MADEVDRANDLAELEARSMIASARARASIPAGEPGECVWCGEDSPRLVNGRCAPCRDGRRRRAA